MQIVSKESAMREGNDLSRHMRALMGIATHASCSDHEKQILMNWDTKFGENCDKWLEVACVNNREFYCAIMSFISHINTAKNEPINYIQHHIIIKVRVP